MEENLQQPIASQSVQSEPVLETIVVPPKPNSVLPYIVVMVLAAISAGAFYFYNQNTELKTQLASVSSPSPKTNTTNSTDLLSDWQVYTNSKYGFTFKFPGNLGHQGAVAGPSSGTSDVIESFSDPKTIREGTDAPFDGFSVYVVTDLKANSFDKYIDNEIKAMDSSEYSKMQNAKKLTFDKGVVLTSTNADMAYYYLPTEDGENVIVFAYIQANTSFKNIFDQIISTVKFMQNPNSQSILDIIPTLTTPMVWSKPIEGTLMNAAGDEVPGTIISSKVATKQENIFAGLLVTDTPIVKEYGWAEDPRGMADGMGESISTYTKNNQTLIIRYKGGEYKVLLSK